MKRTYARRAHAANGHSNGKKNFYHTSLKHIKKHPVSFGAITFGLGLLSSVYVYMRSRSRRYF